MPAKKFAPPWRHDSELALLRDDFYPKHATPDPFSTPSDDRRQHAVDIVSVYVFRNPHTPHAVTATASLTEALLESEKNGLNQGVPANVLRSTFAMAFIKFVNGFVDRDIAAAGDSLQIDDTADITETSDDEQHEHAESSEAEMKAKVKGRGETSMYAFAVKIDMPEDFVDLRHSIVHGEVPSLATLRRYTESALEWLWQKWWSRNAVGDPSQARQEEMDDQEDGEMGRRKSLEAWAKYAEDRDQSSAVDVGHREDWDDFRLQRMRERIDKDRY